MILGMAARTSGYARPMDARDDAQPAEQPDSTDDQVEDQDAEPSLNAPEEGRPDGQVDQEQ